MLFGIGSAEPIDSAEIKSLYCAYGKWDDVNDNEYPDKNSKRRHEAKMLHQLTIPYSNELWIFFTN